MSADGRPGAVARFALCLECGHVYQDPFVLNDTPLDDDAPAGWVPRRWGDRPATHGERPGEVVAWMTGRVESLPRRGAVLPIGLSADDFILPLRRQGWEVDEGAARRSYALILLSHVLEYLADPIPFLRQLRTHLDEEGALFVSTLNVLDPRPPQHLQGEVFSASHLRLYSAGALQTILARAGFRTDAMRCFPDGAGMGLIARPADWAPDQPYDDPSAVRRLIEPLQGPGPADVLGANLVALGATQPWVVPTLCRQWTADAFEVRRSGPCLLALNGATDDGDTLPVVRWGELDGHRTDPITVPEPAAPTVVQLGLGSGELARWLAERLYPAQHLFIWETDPGLAKRVLDLVDFSPLWFSNRVSLVIGEAPSLPEDRWERLHDPALIYHTHTARTWNPWQYRNVIMSLTPWRASLTHTPRLLH
jgi:hypothetical protein